MPKLRKPEEENRFGYSNIGLYICGMKIKITVKYHIEIGNEIIECDTLEKAENKMKHLAETDKYLIKTEMQGDKIVAQYLIG